VIADTPSVTQLSQVITQAIAPAFLLGALAAFISVLTLRMNRIVDRSQMLNAIDDADTARARLKTDLPRMRQRAILLNNATFFATLSAIFATLLVMVAFVAAFFDIQHERGIAVLFIITLGLFAAALVNFARETRDRAPRVRLSLANESVLCASPRLG
jgi:cytochrome c biogenesis protein CcdA